MALLDYKIPYKNCLISCSGVGEAKVGDVYKFIPDQAKNSDWPDFVKYPIKSIVRDRETLERMGYVGYDRLYCVQIDTSVYEVGTGQQTVDSCTFTDKFVCGECCDDIKDTTEFTDKGNGTNLSRNPDTGAEICSLACPPEGTPAGARPVTDSDGNITWELPVPPTTVTVTESSTGTWDIYVNGNLINTIVTTDVELNDDGSTTITDGQGESYTGFRSENVTTSLQLDAVDYDPRIITAPLDPPANPLEGDTHFERYLSGLLSSTYDADSGSWISTFYSTEVFTETDTSDFVGTDTASYDRHSGDEQTDYRGYNAATFDDPAATRGHATRIGIKVVGTGLAQELIVDYKNPSSRTVYVDPLAGSNVRTYSAGSETRNSDVYDEARPWAHPQEANNAMQPGDTIVVKSWNGTNMIVSDLKGDLVVQGGQVRDLWLRGAITGVDRVVVNAANALITGRIINQSNKNTDVIVGSVHQSPDDPIPNLATLRANDSNLTILGNSVLYSASNGTSTGSVLFNGAKNSTATIMGNYSLTFVGGTKGSVSTGMVSQINGAENSGLELFGDLILDPSVELFHPIRSGLSFGSYLICHKPIVTPLGISITDTPNTYIKGPSYRATSSIPNANNGVEHINHGADATTATQINDITLDVDELISDNGHAWDNNGKATKTRFVKNTEFISGASDHIIRLFNKTTDPFPAAINIEFQGGSKFITTGGAPDIFGNEAGFNLNGDIVTNGDIYSPLANVGVVNYIYGGLVTDPNVQP